jgi:hypothetical protein
MKFAFKPLLRLTDARANKESLSCATSARNGIEGRALSVFWRGPDPLLAEGVRKLIEEAEAEKAARHAEQQK